MIVGNGLIANLFRENDSENVVFFASGVSNSLETDKSAFLREENLLRKTLEENPEKIFIYFSTVSYTHLDVYKRQTLMKTLK